MSVQIYKQCADRFLSSSTLIHNFCIALITDGVVYAVRAEATADGSFIAIMLAITQFRIIYINAHTSFFLYMCVIPPAKIPRSLGL
jgi:hypothetical protein